MDAAVVCVAKLCLMDLKKTLVGQHLLSSILLTAVQLLKLSCQLELDIYILGSNGERDADDDSDSVADDGKNKMMRLREREREQEKLVKS